MLLAAVKRIELLYRDKENLYLLVTILGDPIIYGDGIIQMETGLVKVEIKGQRVSISFNILLLGKDKAVLGILFFESLTQELIRLLDKLRFKI